jgi:2-phosphoglycerate kinase
VVILVLGASGVGKSRVAVPLAARLGVRLAEADDIVTALLALTTPEQLPLPHQARDHFAIADALTPGFRAVIADHLEFEAPVVFEGDFLLPELVAEFRGAVRAVLIVEPEVEELPANFLAREPESGARRDRAESSVLIGAELARRAKTVGVPVIPARPWDTVLDRTLVALTET